MGHDLAADGDAGERGGVGRDVGTVDDEQRRQGHRVAGTTGDLLDLDDVTHEAAKLAAFTISGEVVAQTKGPKIKIHKYKNKTGYHKRQGHRQPLTQIKVTGIESGK